MWREKIYNWIFLFERMFELVSSSSCSSRKELLWEKLKEYFWVVNETYRHANSELNLFGSIHQLWDMLEWFKFIRLKTIWKIICIKNRFQPQNWSMNWMAHTRWVFMSKVSKFVLKDKSRLGIVEVPLHSKNVY